MAAWPAREEKDEAIQHASTGSHIAQERKRTLRSNGANTGLHVKRFAAGRLFHKRVIGDQLAVRAVRVSAAASMDATTTNATAASRFKLSMVQRMMRPTPRPGAVAFVRPLVVISISRSFSG